ncbi:quinone oxidoreductase [Elasticomyces elasticus]|uniref:Quinone oxidoreductase n=1 Tax=Elasticomyces elasticus TaxID=574655 RepID=A0AAN7VYR7_9PEZI|nr:quinone oxidoreductase [Elasticomyces elasticus]
MVSTRQWILAKKPTNLPIFEGPDATFKLVDKHLPELQDGEVLVKVTHLSNDPAQRGWISPDIKPERLYIAPVEVNQVMASGGLAEVVESRSKSFKKGDAVTGFVGWNELAILSDKAVQPAFPILGGKKHQTLHLGAFGLTGLTAYVGLLDVGRVTKDDVLVISGAAGATGSMAVQIAKNIIGVKRVVGIAGTDAKCRWVESLGADVCLNYKSSSFAEDLIAATPDYATAYFDNVGGEILDLMITRLGRGGRIIACGAIADYNSVRSKTSGVKNWFEIIAMRLSVHGFVVLDFLAKAPEATKVLLRALEEGKLIVDGGEQVVEAKFEDVPKIWVTLFEGSNTGKLITKIQ